MMLHRSKAIYCREQNKWQKKRSGTQAEMWARSECTEESKQMGLAQWIETC